MFPNSSFIVNSSEDSSRANSGCLSAVLQRFRIARGRVPEVDNGAQGVDRVYEQVQELQHKNSSSPGIVARLMGLDSMPVVLPYSPKSFGRSRSVDSVDIWPGFLCSERSHRVQIRTSRSFREDSTYSSQENDNLLVLSFGREVERKRFTENGSKGSNRAVREKQMSSNRSTKQTLKNKSKTASRTAENKNRTETRNRGRIKESSSRQRIDLGAKSDDHEKPWKQDKTPFRGQ